MKDVLIQKTFFDMLEKMPINKITVTEICSTLNINRGTFYRYYQDIYEILEIEEEHFLNEISESMENFLENDNKNIDQLCVILEITKKYSKLLKSIYTHTDFKKFNEKFSKVIFEYYLEKHKNIIKPKYNDISDYIYKYCISGCVGILVSWIKNDTKNSILEIAELMHNITNFGMNQFSMQNNFVYKTSNEV